MFPRRAQAGGVGGFVQEVLTESWVSVSGSQSCVGPAGGLIVFDRCKACDRTTGIPSSAADDRVSVLDCRSGLVGV